MKKVDYNKIKVGDIILEYGIRSSWDFICRIERIGNYKGINHIDNPRGVYGKLITPLRGNIISDSSRIPVWKTSKLYKLNKDEIEDIVMCDRI